jgi:hypothetical protein
MSAYHNPSPHFPRDHRFVTQRRTQLQYETGTQHHTVSIFTRITLRMSKGFLVSAGMMLPISEAGNSGSSKLPALCV